MGLILSFFTGPFGKIAMYAIGALLIGGLLWAAVAHYDHIISENASLKQENAQLLQSVRDKDKEIKDTRDLMDLQSTSIDTLQQSIEEINKGYSSLEQYLESKEAQEADRPSSDVLKQTIRKLKGMIK